MNNKRNRAYLGLSPRRTTRKLRAYIGLRDDGVAASTDRDGHGGYSVASRRIRQRQEERETRLVGRRKTEQLATLVAHQREDEECIALLYYATH